MGGGHLEGKNVEEVLYRGHPDQTELGQPHLVLVAVMTAHQSVQERCPRGGDLLHSILCQGGSIGSSIFWILCLRLRVQDEEYM